MIDFNIIKNILCKDMLVLEVISVSYYFLSHHIYIYLFVLHKY